MRGAWFIPKKKPEKTMKNDDLLQPELNIGLVGHVDHGKTTLTEALTGKWTDTHSEELKRGITIRLGYADAVFRKCSRCREPDCYATKDVCSWCKGKTGIARKVSFVDAPGHESLMATMLSGAAIIDAALLLVAADEPCPRPQTQEHLVALEITGIKNVIVVQNKIDLVTKQQAKKNYREIKDFLKGTPYKNAAVIPVSAQKRINIDVIIGEICSIPLPERDLKKEPLLFIARSFDINKPGSDPLKMFGGVLGGALKQGVLKVGDEIEIKPGRKTEKSGKASWHSITTKIIGLKTGGENVSEIHPGGSVGVLTSLDPAVVKSDSLGGSVAGKKGNNIPAWHEFNLEIHLLERVVGAKDRLVVEPIKQNESLMLNVNSATTVGLITSIKKNAMQCVLRIPVCAEKGSRVTISRMIGSRWRLIGYGEIR